MEINAKWQLQMHQINWNWIDWFPYDGVIDLKRAEALFTLFKEKKRIRTFLRK